MTLERVFDGLFERARSDESWGRGVMDVVRVRVDNEGEDRNVALVRMVEIEIVLEGVFLIAVVVVLQNGFELLDLNFLHILAVGQAEIVVVAVVVVVVAVVVVVVVVEDPC